MRISFIVQLFMWASIITGLYAMPSLVDEQTITIFPSSSGPLLIEGPKPEFHIDSNPGIQGSDPNSNEDPLSLPGIVDIADPEKSVLLFGECEHLLNIQHILDKNVLFLSRLLSGAGELCHEADSNTVPDC